MKQDIKWGELYGNIHDVMPRAKRWQRLNRENDGYFVMTELTYQEAMHAVANKRALIRESVDINKSTLFKLEFFTRK